MAITTSYKKLFEIKVLHHFHLNVGNTHFEDMSSADQLKRLNQYDLQSFFEILPTSDTIQRLKDYRLRMVPTATGFLVVSPVHPDDNTKPTKELETGKFIFGMYSKGLGFPQYSNLPLAFEFHSDSQKNEVLSTYYFSNTSQNKVSGNLNLSSPIPTFLANGNYSMGDIVLFNGKTYEAREHITNSPNSPGSEWAEIKTLGYVTANDILRLRPGIFRYLFTATGITADIEVRDTVGQPVKFRDDFLDLVDKQTFTSSPEEMSRAINVSNITPGRYNLEVANVGNTYTESQPFYYHPEFTMNKPFGIIEIEIDPTGSDYDLLTGSGNIKSPEYIIRFQNRYTKWSYLDKKDKSLVTVTGADDPLPFTDFGNFDIKFNSKSLPNANPGVIRKSSTHWVSEIVVDKELLSN